MVESDGRICAKDVAVYVCVSASVCLRAEEGWGEDEEIDEHTGGKRREEVERGNELWKMKEGRARV